MSTPTELTSKSSALTLAAVFSLLAFGACESVRPCAEGSLFLELVVNASAATATTLRFDVEVGGHALHSVVPYAGQSKGSVELPFPGTYPAGQMATVTVSAMADAIVLASGMTTTTLGGTCAHLSLTLDAVAAQMRDPLKWPFASTSIWNTPIGTGAVYVSTNISAIPSSVSASMPGIDDERIILRPTSPVTNVYFSSAAWTGQDRCAATGSVLFTAPFPSDFIVAGSSHSECATFLQSDGHTLTQTQPFTRCATGAVATSYATPTPALTVDLYGPGITGSHGGSGLSAFGGSIRIGELRPGQVGMRHALKIDVDTTAVLAPCTTTSDCFRWPAINADNNAVGTYGSANAAPVAAMKMGALLAIPANVDLTKLGLETEPATQLAWTLQNYGAYIVNGAGAPGVALNAENGPDGSMRAQFAADWSMAFEQLASSGTPWSRDMQRLVLALSVVDNNGPTSIGGGGIPLQLPAPPIP